MILTGAPEAGGEVGGVVGAVVGGVVGAVVGGVVGVVAPVQSVPLRRNAVGDVPEPAPLKPNEVVAPVAIEPFQAALPTVTFGPDWVTTPFQSWLTVCPDGKAKVSDHWDTGSPRLVIATEAPKPPGQELVTW